MPQSGSSNESVEDSWSPSDVTTREVGRTVWVEVGMTWASVKSASGRGCPEGEVGGGDEEAEAGGTAKCTGEG